MARCSKPKCYHCIIVEKMLGSEGKSFGNSEVERMTELGSMALPNDHSRRSDGSDWCTRVESQGGVLGPNKAPYCKCFTGPNHIFLSTAECYGPRGPGGKHSHSTGNRYTVVNQLRWCNGTPAS